MLCRTVIYYSVESETLFQTHQKKYLPSNYSKIFTRSIVMLKIKLYLILSSILVFNLFEESCAIGNRQRGGGRKSNSRRPNNCPTVGRNPSRSIDCKYFWKM